MDPWLELYWPDVHARLTIYAADALQIQLPPDLVARAEASVTLDIAPERRLYRPDVRVAEESFEPWALREGAVAASAVADPILVELDEPATQRHLEIVDSRSGGRIVTVIEILSHANKASAGAENPYLAKRRDYLGAGVNLVEINLLRGGLDICLVPAAWLVPSDQTPCRVGIFRATRPGFREVIPLPLRQRLPAIRIPLRPEDRDVVLDLQALIDQAYRQGRYHLIDYDLPLDPPLSAADDAWARERLAGGAPG